VEAESSAIGAVAALDDPVRRRLYAVVRSRAHPVTREEAAAEAGISRKLAAFHLDKLVEVGLLEPGSRAASGRVGRAPKTYAPAPRPVQVSIPPRTHVDLAEVLVDATRGQRRGESPAAAGFRVAAEKGEQLGRLVDAPRGRLGAERGIAVTMTVLGERGYEPYLVTKTCVRMRNCPFHPLAERAPDLVCGINQAFLAGLLSGLGADRLEAVLAPSPGECCVEVRPRA